ncbi:putative porin [Blattabacterium cuenoti]|uniref:putative porin n=1 Tax=Blattabacterium cuenoti TaxID=1653831 RepID=UPI00163CA1CC|nr:putative porin [Blattabacterium cuenoti]
MKIFISILFLFGSQSMEKKMINFHFNENQIKMFDNENQIKMFDNENQIKMFDNENIRFYHPTYQDYKFWTEEKNRKRTFIENDFSIKKYHSHNFFKNDNIGLLFIGGKDLLISNINEEITKENFNENMPKKMHFFNDIFFYREKIKYFDVKTPISEIFYINDFLKKEKTLGGLFSQNFYENTNYSIEYRNFHSESENETEKSKNLILNTFNYQDQNDYNYKLWGHHIYQKFDVKDKEEIPNLKWKDCKNILFYHKKLIHNRFYINFIKKISSLKEKNKSFLLKNYVEYEKYSIFQDLQKEKIKHSYLRNGLFLILNHRKINLEIGSIFDRIYYQIFNNSIYKNKNINNLSIQTKIHYPINNFFEFYSNGKWIVDNNIKKPFFNGNIILNTFLFPKFRISTQLSIDKNDYGFYNNFIPIYILKKNQDYYNNKQKNILSFNRKETINFSLNSHEEKYYLSFYVSRLNHLFQDQEQETEKLSSRKHVQLYGFKIKTTYDIWKFQINNIFLYHKYDSNPLVFSAPSFLYRNTIFYKDNYFHDALFIQTGFSFHYFNNFYYKKIYYPFDFQTFSSKKECVSINEIGGTPFINYFFNFKINRTILYFSIENIGFYNVYNSHDNNLFIKTGLLWNLFT